MLPARPLSGFARFRRYALRMNPCVYGMASPCPLPDKSRFHFRAESGIGPVNARKILLSFLVIEPRPIGGCRAANHLVHRCSFVKQRSNVAIIFFSGTPTNLVHFLCCKVGERCHRQSVTGPVRRMNLRDRLTARESHFDRSGAADCYLEMIPSTFEYLRISQERDARSKCFWLEILCRFQFKVGRRTVSHPQTKGRVAVQYPVFRNLFAELAPEFFLMGGENVGASIKCSSQDDDSDLLGIGGTGVSQPFRCRCQ